MITCYDKRPNLAWAKTLSLLKVGDKKLGKTVDRGDKDRVDETFYAELSHLASQPTAQVRGLIEENINRGGKIG